MPTYDYRCGNCEHKFEKYLKVAERKKPEKEKCPSCGKKNKIELVFGAPALCDPVRVGTKTPDKGFRDVLSKIKSKHPRHNIKDRW